MIAPSRAARRAKGRMARLVRLGPTALLYPHNKEWIGGEKERAGTMLDDSCEGSATIFRQLSAWRKNRPRTSGGSVTGRRIVSAGTRFTTGCRRRPMKLKIA